jgi:LPS-assembly protein
MKNSNRLAFSALLLVTVFGLAHAAEQNRDTAFTADDVQYDQEHGIVTATGHVEAWQNDRGLSADKVTFDRNTGVATATGHVVLTEPDGQVYFADTAQLTQDMKDGVLTGMRALLAQNGKLAANSARRTGGLINELSRAIYSTCNLCKKDPDFPPMWDIRARTAVQDTEHKQIEYTDAIVDFYGIPVFYTPYLTHPDPSQDRATGLLVPSLGFSSSHLGSYVGVPYYIVIDKQSDVTLTTMLTSKAGQAEFADYRLRLDDGQIRLRASIADEFDRSQGHLFAKGDFALDDVWRWGFDVNHVSGAAYARDYGIAAVGQSVLPSTIFLEGFGDGAYSRTDVRFYQSLSAYGPSSMTPFVLPRTQFSYVGVPDGWGGRLSVDTGAFNVYRSQGTSTQRVNLDLDWKRPFVAANGQVWEVGVHLDSAAYNAHGLDLAPTYGPVASDSTSQAMPTAYAEMRWPFQRSAGDGWGTQLIEPIVKVMVAPRGLSYKSDTIPNEDSLDVEFTDSNLFALNRNPGIDRLEGGDRVAIGLHGNWTLPGGQQLDGIVGQSYRDSTDPYFPVKSGLQGTVSDVVARQSLQPTPWLDLTMRERFDHDTWQTRFADFTTTIGSDRFNVTAGYTYSNTSNFYVYDYAPNSPQALQAYNTPRNEASLGISTKFGNWRFSGNATQSLRLDKPVEIDAHVAYENECAIFDVQFYRRYTSILNDNGDTGILFNITLKTVGEFGFHGG